MPVVISLLRGVNLGGNHMVPMEALRALYESLGHRDVKTYIQSGNVVSRTAKRNLAVVRREIEDGIEKTFGFRAAVLLRTTAEMSDVVARNPFAGRPEVSGSKLIVYFLDTEPAEAMTAKLISVENEGEEVAVRGRELYVHFPNGMGVSKVPVRLGKLMKMLTTARNWNSVTKLLAMAQESK